MNLAARLPRWSLLLVAASLLAASGCVNIHMPKPRTGEQHRVHTLSDHVEFLTQPGLKGRKCRSLESGYVRQYIRQEFEASGLVPWATASGFDQSFGFGTNVVGVLRGQDPILSDQIVLVAAHYDSLGERDGNLYPGAANDAAGMAVLLQLAERLGSPSQRRSLRRSVAFAAFDCGEQRWLGAFSFTLRSDFDPSKIAVVIDMDLLGRNNFGVVENTLIVVGTERYPQIRQIVNAAARQTSSRPAGEAATMAASGPATQPGPVRIMQGGIDLLPPISGYFAFQQWPMPVLLFTNGLYFDYHKPTDTPDKLHYDLLNKDADVVLRTVRDLASMPQGPARVEPLQADRDELRSILTTLEDVLAGSGTLSLTPLEQRRLGSLADRARLLLAKDPYTFADRRAFLLDLARQGAPSIIRFFYAPPKPDPATVFSAQRLAGALTWYEFFAAHRPFASRGMQQVVRHFLNARGNLLRLLSSYTFQACEILPDEIVYRREGPRDRLSFLYPQLKIKAGIGGSDLDVNYTAVDCRGTPGEIVDFCLLYASMGDPACMAGVMPAVLTRVTGHHGPESVEDVLASRRREAGAANEAAWRRSLWQTRNPDLLKLLLRNAAADKHEPPTDVLVDILADPTMRPDVRIDAIQALPADADRPALLALAGLVESKALVRKADVRPAFDPTFPFYQHVAMQEVRTKPSLPPQTGVGPAAQERLKALTGQEFRADADAWRRWINGRRN